jgi:hypothetical protein
MATVLSEDQPSREAKSRPVGTVGHALELAHSENVKELLDSAATISAGRPIGSQTVSAYDIFLNALAIGKAKPGRSATWWLYEWMAKQANKRKLNSLIKNLVQSVYNPDAWSIRLTGDAEAVLERARMLSKLTMDREKFDARHVIAALSLPDPNKCNESVLRLVQDNLDVDLTKFNDRLIQLIEENPENNERLEVWKEQQKTPTPSPTKAEFNTQFVPDDAEVDHDQLGRGVLAVALARRVHKIWCSLNDATAPEPTRLERPSAETPLIDSATWTGNPTADDSVFFDRHRDNTRGSFVLHLDAPWGGGKTTFANFLARVLNPDGFERDEKSFLQRRYGRVNISTIFLQDPPSVDGASLSVAWPKDARRPWIIVPFNAWQVEHCTPPWWVFLSSDPPALFRFDSSRGESCG